MDQKRYDIIILGSGVGGGTMARSLAGTGAKILLIERGDFIPQEPENWDGKAVFQDKRYTSVETFDGQNLNFFYCVGGASKVYGAAMHRLRKEDFGVLQHAEGESPNWPITYEDLEPYYAQAEQIYHVHGDKDSDPTEPPHSGPYPFPGVPHEPTIQRLKDRLTKAGLQPYALPVAIDLRSGGKCIRCKTCDGYPCKLHAKGDADVNCVRPALEHPNVTLLTNCYAQRLVTDPTGTKVEAIELNFKGETLQLSADLFVVSCGAIQSALLLLRSSSGKHSQGLANSSGQVGRNLMAHNGGIVFCFDIWHSNRDHFHNTLGFNDFYFKGQNWDYPMGHAQLWGRMSPYLLKQFAPNLPFWEIKAILSRSFAILLQSEDLPDPNNRVFLDDAGRVHISWKPNNLSPLYRLMDTTTDILKRCGYTKIKAATSYAKDLDKIPQVAHQMGTLRFGNDPANSVLNPFCRTHDIENLYVVDASFFPSSAAVNPALTIAAQSLRVADHIKDVARASRPRP